MDCLQLPGSALVYWVLFPDLPDRVPGPKDPSNRSRVPGLCSHYRKLLIAALLARQYAYSPPHLWLERYYSKIGVLLYRIVPPDRRVGHYADSSSTVMMRAIACTAQVVLMPPITTRCSAKAAHRAILPSGWVIELMQTSESNKSHVDRFATSGK